jgi:hypothetical protein
MIQRDLPEIFNDCINRMAAGWTVDECLSEYPADAARLRPMLEAGLQVRFMRLRQPELLEDQEIVWRRLVGEESYALPLPPSRNRRGYRVLGQLMAAVFLLLLLVGATWFVLTRLILPPDVPILETLTPTATLTVTGSPTVATTPTITPSSTLTVTQTSTTTTTPSLTVTQTSTTTTTPAPTQTPTPTATQTVTGTFTATLAPSPTPSATGTFSACGEPRTAQDAINAVLNIYPNTTITSVLQITKFGDTLVWEVKTSHGLIVNIDVACGTILTIEQPGSTTSVTSTPQPGTGGLPNSNDNNSGGGSGGDSGNNQNNNSNGNDNGEDSGGSGMGSGS